MIICVQPDRLGFWGEKFSPRHNSAEKLCVATFGGFVDILGNLTGWAFLG